MRGVLAAATTCMSLAVLAPSALAADAEAGRQTAERLCAPCHAIGKTDTGPHAEAPPFREFERKWPLDSLAEALAEGIVVGHPDMPEFTMSQEDIADFLAYLGTIQTP